MLGLCVLWSCTNYKDHKDTLKGHIDSFYSLSIPSFIKECGLKKGCFGKADVTRSGQSGLASISVRMMTFSWSLARRYPWASLPMNTELYCIKAWHNLKLQFIFLIMKASQAYCRKFKKCIEFLRKKFGNNFIT